MLTDFVRVEACLKFKRLCCFRIALAFRDCVNDSKVYCQAETIGKEVNVRE